MSSMRIWFGQFINLINGETITNLMLPLLKMDSTPLVWYLKILRQDLAQF